MSDRAAAPERNDGAIDLTTRIKALSDTNLKVAAAKPAAEQRHRALLLCRDARARKWGPKWLWHAGFDTEIFTDCSQALESIEAGGAGILIVEASLRDGKGAPVCETLRQAIGDATPIIALCSNSSEMTAALDLGVYDVVRKPVEWRLVSRRARKALHGGQTRAKLDRAERSLRDALKLADRARRNLRSRESFDPVTGLPTKAKFAELIRQAMSAAGSDTDALAVFVIGFSRFRLVVEAMGQGTVELVMAEVARRLNAFLGDLGPAHNSAQGLRTAAAASFEAERFGLMMTCSGDTDELAAMQQRLSEELSRPVQVNGQTVYLSACIGAAIYPRDATDADQLMQRADNAMRDVQSRGGGFRFYSTEADAAAARKLRIEHLLHEAMVGGDLKVAYQPMTDVRSGKIVGAEALLRWRLDDGTVVAPAEFVPIAEDCGLMIRIGEFVLDQACQRLSRWQALSGGEFRMSVNVSRCQLMSGGFVATVRRLIAQHGIDPGQLDLELSERGVLSGDYSVIGQLEELKKLGVKLSIDDFGTGESAMAYLKELPVDIMKIDRSYISGVTKSRKDIAITSAMVALGQQLDLVVIAEGVETSEQLDFLKALGCDVYQGFHLSPAVSSDEFAGMLGSGAGQ